MWYCSLTCHVHTRIQCGIDHHCDESLHCSQLSQAWLPLFNYSNYYTYTHRSATDGLRTIPCVNPDCAPTCTLDGGTRYPDTSTVTQVARFTRDDPPTNSVEVLTSGQPIGLPLMRAVTHSHLYTTVNTKSVSDLVRTPAYATTHSNPSSWCIDPGQRGCLSNLPSLSCQE